MIGKHLSDLRKLLLAAACCSPAIHASGPVEIPTVTTHEAPLAQAIDEARRRVEADPSSAAAWGALGEIYDVHSFEEAAIEAYARAEELDPDEWRWPYFDGLLLSDIDPAAALDRLSRAAALRPDYAPLRYHLGFGCYLAGEMDEAERQLRRALALDGASINAMLGLARVAVDRGDPAAALAGLERAAELAPEAGAVHVHLAQVYRELGRTADAEREELLAEGSRPPAPNGEAALADPVRDEVVSRVGVSAMRLVEKGQRYLAEGRADEAAESIARALVADPDSVPALVASARLSMSQGRYDRARAELERAVELDAESSAAWSELGTLHALARRIAPAIAALERAVAIDPELFISKTNLAGLYASSGRNEQALVLLGEASHDAPGNIDILHKTASVLLDLDRREDAVRVLRRMVDLAPARPDLRADLGQVLWRSQRYGEAIRVFREGLTAAPQDPGLQRWLVWSLSTCPLDELRDGSEALALAGRLWGAAAADDARLLDALAAALAETGDFESAVDRARRGLALVEQDEHLAQQLRERLALYERGRPYRDR